MFDEKDANIAAQPENPGDSLGTGRDAQAEADAASTGPEARPPVRELSPVERRVLGVLVEKAYTTPEYYPLTLKALITGSNQKSNRDPVTHYSEDDVLEALDSLREKHLAATVHTESGRTERFRHYMRHRFELTEPQLAVLTELLLRGRQQLGELRSRASRMVGIETLDALRAELQGLMRMGLVQSSGALERRGVEVDHALYRSKEGKTMAASQEAAPSDSPPRAPSASSSDSLSTGSSAEFATKKTEDTRELAERIAALEGELGRLREELRETRSETESVQQQLQDMTARLETLMRDLGQ